MPQMAPLMWLTLFLIFLSAFMMFNILNYFNFLNNKKMKNLDKNIINNKFFLLNWKW